MFMPGTRFGKFEIIEQLGSGSMGVVYRANDTALDRTVALKMIHEDLATSDNYRSLLTSEAKSAAKIDSPNVVRIWEHGQIDDQLFISLEYIDGPDLRAASKAMSFSQKIDVARQLAAGIDAAHKLGLLHRDLKPENIKITHDSVLKIMDFGLARQLSAHDTELALRVRTTGLNTEGGFVGTISYASPEQLSGESLTLRSDIFSAGVILYELFTGARPFEGDYPARIVYSILNEEPPSPRDISSDLPMWLDQMILQAIAKRPVDRLEGACEMLRILDGEYQDREVPDVRGIIRARQTVTVIDLRNLSDDPSWDYFSQGFTEEVIREIGRRTDLVISAQPSAVYTRNLQELVDKCRSDFIITGSLLKSGQRIRMSLNVYRSRGLQQVSGESYECSIEGLFDMLLNAAVDIARRLSVYTSSKPINVGDPLQMDVGAYEYYLKGRTYYQTSKPEDLLFAEMMYRRALEIDSSLALAHAGLADVYAYQYMFYYDRSPEKIANARKEATLALDISPNLAEAYRSLGRCSQSIGDFADAEHNFRKAIDCNPKFALAYRAMAWLEEVQGDHDESMRWARKALELSPLDLETLLLIGILYMDTRKYTAALSTLQRAVELGPDYGRAHYELATVFLKIGALDEALVNFEQACRFKGDPNAHIEAGYIYLIKGQFEAARERFQASLDGGFFTFVAAYFLGFLERLAGRNLQSRHWLEKSIELGEQCDPSSASNSHVLGYRALALAVLGRAEEAEQVIAELRGRKEIDGESLHCMARAFAVMNAQDKAREYCRRALGAHAGPTESELTFDPHFR
jgi:serine/threonine protein kinase/Tfp pilus assembly protein PilF